MRYRVKVVQGGQGVSTLTLDADSAGDAALQANARGYQVLGVSRVGFGGRRSRFPLLLFSQELQALLAAGPNLIEALETLAERDPHSTAGLTVADLLAHLRAGHTFSASLQRHPEAFPALYVASIRASETSGDLVDALRRYIAYQNQVDAVRKKIASASMYPVMLLTLGALVFAFLLAYVIPRFSRIYQPRGSSLSGPSRLLLEWGRVVDAHGPAILVGICIAISALAVWFMRPEVRAWVTALLWRIPALGERLRVFHLARLYRTLAMLLRGGIPVVTALDMSAGLLDPVLRARLAAARQAVSDGGALSASLLREGLTTPVGLRLMRVAESTGRMDDMLERSATFHEEEVARWVDTFTRLFEPALMAVIGFVIGGVVLLMYMPIFELANSIQ